MLDIKERFATLETAEGATLIGVGVAIILGQVTGLLPFIAIGLIASGAYKLFVKRKD